MAFFVDGDFGGSKCIVIDFEISSNAFYCYQRHDFSAARMDFCSLERSSFRPRK